MSVRIVLLCAVAGATALSGALAAPAEHRTRAGTEVNQHHQRLAQSKKTDDGRSPGGLPGRDDDRPDSAVPGGLPGRSEPRPEDGARSRGFSPRAPSKSAPEASPDASRPKEKSDTGAKKKDQ